MATLPPPSQPVSSVIVAIKLKLQYSHSPFACLSTHNTPSPTRSSTTVLALAPSHPKLSLSIPTLTYPSTCTASSTAA